MRSLGLVLVVLLIASGVPDAASAGPLPVFASLTPGQQCRAAIERAERAYGVPSRLLAAIGVVESGRPGPDGRIDPWPFSINAEGTDHVYASKAEAIAAVRALQSTGMRSIDIGCMQVNLMHHPTAFASLEEAFDPWRNADYAARFLVRLKQDRGSWEAATASYHSATPELGQPYAAKVRVALATEAGTPAPFAAFGTSLPGAGRPAVGISGATGRLLPLPAGSALGGGGPLGGTGRGLAAYRNNPVRLSSALLRR